MWWFHDKFKMIIEPLAFAFSICLKLLTNKSSILVWKEQWTPVWHELFMRDHIVSFLSGVLGLDGEKCTVPTKQCSPDWRRPPPTPVAMGLRASGHLCPPISPRCGSGTDPRHFLPVSACPYCVPCNFWLIGTHMCCFLLTCSSKRNITRQYFS